MEGQQGGCGGNIWSVVWGCLPPPVPRLAQAWLQVPAKVFLDGMGAKGQIKFQCILQQAWHFAQCSRTVTAARMVRWESQARQNWFKWVWGSGQLTNQTAQQHPAPLNTIEPTWLAGPWKTLHCRPRKPPAATMLIPLHFRDHGLHFLLTIFLVRQVNAN